MKAAIAFELQPERARLLWALAALLAMSLPLLRHLAPWVTLAAVWVLLWRLGVAYGRLPRFNRYTRVGLGLLAFLGVFATYHTFNGPAAGSALLILLATLKLMEAKGLRDYSMVLLIALFIGISCFLYGQSIPLALYMIPAVWLAIAALLNIAHPDVNRTLAASIKTAAGALLPALPIALVLFLLFPRIPGPLWGVALPQRSGVTGLSPRMSPGSISRLAESDAIAFSVKFMGPVPTRSQLYWRALVLHDFDGTTWTRGRAMWINDEKLQTRGAPVRYQVTLEPNDLRVLYSLDMPVAIPANARLTSDYELIAPAPVTELKRYQVASDTDYRYGIDTPTPLLRRDLRLPNGIDPRARELARQWRASSHNSPARIVRDALRLFHNGPFVYSLQPGTLTSRNSVDEFLFSTRRGFCEHYASAFVFLMRAAGIPAHVVIGYQGGSVNPIDGYYTVRQDDAHAWAEVWLAGRGWVRVDPTAAVDPARVDEGLAAALPASEVPGYLFHLHPWLGKLRDGWDAVNNGWNQWVLAYGPELQQRLLMKVGLNYASWVQLSLVLTFSMGAILLALWLLVWWRNRPPPASAVARDYERFCRKFAKIGLARKPHEGPLDYANRLVRSRPDLDGQIKAITSLYVDIRYADRGEARQLRRWIRAFHPTTGKSR